MIVNRIFEWARQQPENTAVIWNDVALSYLSFAAAIRKVRTVFQQQTLPVGRTAVVVDRGLLDTWILVMALRSLGLHTISVRSIEQARSLMIRDVACLASTDPEALAHNAAEAFPGAKVVAIAPWACAVNGTDDLQGVADDGRPFGGHILYTSGTTGSYKKVLLSGEHEAGRNRARAQICRLDSKTVYHALDFELFTGTGFKTPSAVWDVGGCVVLDEGKQNFEKYFLHNVNFAQLLPWQLRRLLQSLDPSVRPGDGFALAVGGGFLPIDVAEQAAQKLTGKLIVSYKSTEINGVQLRSHFRTKDDLHWLTPTDARLVQVVDENDRECRAGEEGELRVLLSEIDCHHYLDDAEATDKVFRDGFFYPGDMAVKREDGRIRILGRVNDVVVLKGEKLPTAPMEQEIQSYLQAEEVCVFSGLTAQGNEELIIVIRSERPIQRRQLETVARRFPRFEKVRFSIRKEFPRTEAGRRKTMRGLLKKSVFEEFSDPA